MWCGLIHTKEDCILVLFIKQIKVLVDNSERPNDILLFRNILLFLISLITVFIFKKIYKMYEFKNK